MASISHLTSSGRCSVRLTPSTNSSSFSRPTTRPTRRGGRSWNASGISQFSNRWGRTAIRNTSCSRTRSFATPSQALNSPASPPTRSFRFTKSIAQQNRNGSDTALTPEQRDQALEAVQSAQQNSWRKLLGEEAYQRYLQASTKP